MARFSVTRRSAPRSHSSATHIARVAAMPTVCWPKAVFVSGITFVRRLIATPWSVREVSGLMPSSPACAAGTGPAS